MPLKLIFIYEENHLTLAVAIGFSLAFVSCTPQGSVTTEAKPKASLPPIAREEVLSFIDRWCQGLISMAEAHREGRDVRALAEGFIDEIYDYQHPPVLFKPTLTHGEQTFRLTRRGALAYFIGGDPDYPNDAGFAIKPWKQAQFRLAQDPSGMEGLQQHHDVAIVMGQLFLTDVDGNEVVANKCWALKRDEQGRLKIIAHMSALPYHP